MIPPRPLQVRITHPPRALQGPHFACCAAVVEIYQLVPYGRLVALWAGSSDLNAFDDTRLEWAGPIEPPK